MDATLETVLRPLLFIIALTSSGVGRGDGGVAKLRRVEVKEAFRVPGMYLAGGRSSRKE